MNYVEIIGYVGSVLVAVSLTMKNIYYLRRINLIGASTFAVYGLLVGAMPVFALNTFISIVDIYYIWEAKRKKEYFTLLPIEQSNGPLLNKFLKFYGDNIILFFPSFNKNKIEEDKSFFILRNLIPVGLFVYKEISETEILIELDYAIPDYRDLKNARFVYFAQSKHFSKKGYKTIHAETNVEAHKKYLRKIGFIEQTLNSGKFTKEI
ncbi:MAG: hypothetical protein GY936_01155 [Ignavibacteriae bacterium]|nr:hypothetical protein [Ignavibacteriota bacterium]